MTEEEHKARAMLMGCEYVPHFGYYRRVDNATQVIIRLDALTLEEISRAETIRRQQSKPVKEIWYD